jgi:3-oxoacyl-[acyl-carrier protein] reductase
MLLKGKNIVITGSGRGIGKAVAVACAKEGANLGLTSRTLEELNQTKEEIESLGMDTKVVVKTSDVTKYEEVEELFKICYEKLGPLNVIIANAGYSRMWTTHEFINEKFSQILNTNVLGVFYTFKASYPYLKKDDKKDKARFLITGSAAYFGVMPRLAAYTASKYAVVGLQRALAAEYRSENITFNMILPTMVDTPMQRGSKAGNGNKPDNMLSPEDLNDYYLFFMTPNANRVNDELIVSKDIEEVKKLLSKAPSESRKDWDNFKVYLEQNAPKTYENVRKLGKFIDFIISRLN